MVLKFGTASNSHLEPIIDSLENAYIAGAKVSDLVDAHEYAYAVCGAQGQIFPEVI